MLLFIGFLENAKAFCENALGSPKTPFGGHVTFLPLFIAIVMAIIILGIVGIVGFVVVLMVGFFHLFSLSFSENALAFSENALANFLEGQILLAMCRYSGKT